MTSDEEKSAEEYAAQALQFLAQSDAEFDAGDDRQGAEKLYGAATQAVIAAAKQRGWDYDSHRANVLAASRIGAECDDMFLATGFSASDRFRTHARYGDMEDYQIALDRPVIRDYVLKMVAKIREYERNGHGEDQ